MEKATIYDYARMCSKYAILDCQHCPLSQNNNRLGCSCDDFMRAFSDEANEIILKWCKEHPVKTRQSEIQKIIPEIVLNVGGYVDICPNDIDRDFNRKRLCDNYSGCTKCKKEYWLAEVEENDA